MIGGTLETVLRRERLIVAGALGVIAALAWGYVLWLAIDMDMRGMDMTGFRMIPAGLGIMAPANAPWKAIEFAFVFAMWTVMMVAMMTPSAAPMILMYARVGRQAATAGVPFAATGWRLPWARRQARSAIMACAGTIPARTDITRPFAGPITKGWRRR